jgi:hypothetical protein
MEVLDLSGESLYPRADDVRVERSQSTSSLESSVKDDVSVVDDVTHSRHEGHVSHSSEPSVNDDITVDATNVPNQQVGIILNSSLHFTCYHFSKLGTVFSCTMKIQPIFIIIIIIIIISFSNSSSK